MQDPVAAGGVVMRRRRIPFLSWVSGLFHVVYPTPPRFDLCPSAHPETSYVRVAFTERREGRFDARRWAEDILVMTGHLTRAKAVSQDWGRVEFVAVIWYDPETQAANREAVKT